MDQEAIRQVKRLLGGQDASDVAGWGHQVDDTFPGVARMHFQVHNDQGGSEWCGAAANRIPVCTDNVCLLTSIKHFYGKVLSDEGRKTEYPAIDYAKVDKGVKFTDADAVKMLINLVGDLHQPLHVGFASDDNGHQTKVRYRGKELTLYDMWDKHIGEVIRERQSNFWWGGWTHVAAVKDQFEKDKKLWKEEGAFKSFDRWLDEAVEFACSTAYVHPTTKQKLGGPEAKAGQVVDIDEAAFQTWREAWLKRVLIAGERIAVVLNDILDAGGADKLAKGSGVQTKADEEKAKEAAEWEQERAANRRAEAAAKGILPTLNLSAFVTNLGIACVTVPLFFLFVNHGLNPKVHMQILQSLIEPSATSGGGSGGGGGGGRSSKRGD